jgi:hypothetical protein
MQVETREAICSCQLQKQKNYNLARRFGVAWQRVNRFDDAQDSHFSSSVPIVPRHPVTGSLRLLSRQPANNAGRCCT